VPTRDRQAAAPTTFTDVEPSDLTAVEAQRRLRAGELSSVELVRSCLARVDQLDPVVNAIVTRADERALAEAAAADEAHARGESTGALHGLPVAIKDLQPTAGLRTTYGSPAFVDHVPEADAGIVARIRRAGGIVIGKTNIPERSIGANTVNPLVGATGNPFDPDLTCGGSSGGSAVALASNMAPLATGSDHGGSLRIPACYCGVVGHRATPGVVPHEMRSVTQTHYSVQGPMGRTVADTALLLSVVADRETGNEPRDPMAFPLDTSVFASLDVVEVGRLRIAVSEDLGGVLVSDSIRRTFRDRIERLSHHVAVCEPHPIDLTGAPDVDWKVRADLFVAQYHAEAETWTDEFNPNIRQSYDAALTMPMRDIAIARSEQMRLCGEMQSVFADYDVLICPGVSVPPFPWAQRNPTHVDGRPVDNYMAWLALTASLTVVGHPVTALPLGLDEQGTPFGVQVVGPMYQDHRLLSIAAALEAVAADDAALARPVVDLDALAQRHSTCRDARM